MSQAKPKTPNRSENDRDLQIPKVEPLSSRKTLDERHKLVVEQNERLVRGEATMRDFTLHIEFNNFGVYWQTMKLADSTATINRWLKEKGIVPDAVKSTQPAKRFAMSVRQDDEKGRRSSAAAQVLEAGLRYFEKRNASKPPTRAEFMSWVKECGGLNEIRLGRAPVALGGKEKKVKKKPKSPSELFDDRLKLASTEPSFGSIDYTPEGAVEDELVVFYGIIHDGKTSLRLACRLRKDDKASLNVHSVEPSVIHSGGLPVVPQDIGPGVIVVSDKARTAGEVLDQAAEQAV